MITQFCNVEVINDAREKLINVSIALGELGEEFESEGGE